MKTLIKISSIATLILPLLLSNPAHAEGYMEYYVPLPTYPTYEPYVPPVRQPLPTIDPFSSTASYGSTTGSSNSGFSSSDSYRSIPPSYGTSSGSSAGSTYSRDPVQGMTTELPSGFYGGPSYPDRWYVPAPVESDPRPWVY